MCLGFHGRFTGFRYEPYSLDLKFLAELPSGNDHLNTPVGSDTLTKCLPNRIQPSIALSTL